MTHPESQRRAGLGVTIGFILSMLMALSVALVSVWALREVTRTEEDARESALQLAEIQQLRMSLESRVAAWREFVLNRDDATAEKIEREAYEFQQRLETLRASAPPQFADSFAAVAKAEAAYHEEIRDALKLRGRTVADLGAAVREAQERIRPYRLAVEASLTQLSENARQQIKSDIERTETLETTATAITIAAVAVLLIAAAFGLSLTSELRRAITRERELRTSAEALADEVTQQSRDVEQRLREVTAELDAHKTRRA